MAVKTEAQLNTDIDADITTNGSNDITGAEVNAILSDMVDSSVSRKGTNDTVVLNTVDVASGVNFIQITNAIASADGGPLITATGSDTNVDMTLVGKGTADIHLDFDDIKWGISTTPNTNRNLTAVGSETNIGIALEPKASVVSIGANADIIFITDGKGIADAQENELLAFVKASSAINNFEMTNAATAANPTLSVIGGDTDIDLDLQAKGSGTVSIIGSNLDLKGANILMGAGSILMDSGNAIALTTAEIIHSFAGSASDVNYIKTSAAATGSAVSLSAQGSDTDIKIFIAGKGTGTDSGVVVECGATGRVGFFGTTAVVKQTVTGARDETEGALADLLTKIAAYGFITDSTTAS